MEGKQREFGQARRAEDKETGREAGEVYSLDSQGGRIVRMNKRRQKELV